MVGLWIMVSIWAMQGGASGGRAQRLGGQSPAPLSPAARLPPLGPPSSSSISVARLRGKNVNLLF